MYRTLFLGGAVAVAVAFSLAADTAEAFGGRGYARRSARNYGAVPYVAQRTYVAPVRVYRPAVSVGIGTGYVSPYRAGYGSPYRAGYGGYGYGGYGYGGYRGFGYPAYRGGGVSIGVGRGINIGW